MYAENSPVVTDSNRLAQLAHDRSTSSAGFLGAFQEHLFQVGAVLEVSIILGARRAEITLQDFKELLLDLAVAKTAAQIKLAHAGNLFWCGEVLIDVEDQVIFPIGAEFYLSEVFTLRFGYDNEKRSDLKVGSSSGIAGFNGGLGVKISEYVFNYGYSSLGTIGAMHRIGLATAL